MNKLSRKKGDHKIIPLEKFNKYLILKKKRWKLEISGNPTFHFNLFIRII
jgi:hypothetical protein